MTNKTPLQELIEWMEDKFGKHRDIDTDFFRGINNALTQIDCKATELLEKEKNIIVDAYEQGHTDQFYGENRKETYFNQTFKP